MTTDLFGVTPAAANTASPARRHKMVARGLLVAVMAGGLALGMALPAAAGTGVTVEISTGALAVAVPADSVALSATAIANTHDGSTLAPVSLGDVTVTDEKGTATGGWTATVSASGFTASAGGKTIDVGNLNYTTTDAVPSFGTPTLVTATAFKSAGQALTGSGVTVVTGTRVGGLDNDATWNPSITLTIPGSLAPAIYTATITHSVS